MRLTTLCYIEKDGKYLMLHRTKKKNDENHDKWIGVGGKFEPGESPDECLIREVKEETGLTLITYQFRGIVTFCSDEWEDEYMHLFTATEFERRSQSDCVHEQVAKADCECPLYAQKRENENLRFRTFLKCNADEEKLDRQFKSVPLEKVMAMENSMYYTIRKRRGIWR